MYRERAPLAFFALLFALAGGILLAKSEWVVGGLLIVFALWLR